ncbi:hypothetical protein BDV09DRAFT_158244 [Aspergillus tetrazonus]
MLLFDIANLFYDIHGIYLCGTTNDWTSSIQIYPSPRSPSLITRLYKKAISSISHHTGRV